MRNFIVISFFLFSFAICSGCATLVSDKTTFSQIDSSPSQAICVVEGENYKQIITTPANIILPAKAAPLRISCDVDGYHTSVEQIDTKMDGWTLGNILFGGVIGVVVDAATKSGHKYPENIVITLYRKNFSTQEELDAWYDQLEKEINEKNDSQLSESKSKDKAETSERKNRKIEIYREEQLTKAKKMRSESIVVTNISDPPVGGKDIVK